MSTFKLNYKNGTCEVVQTDAPDAPAQLMRTFGLSPEQAAEFGVSVEMLSDDPVDLMDAGGPDDLEQAQQTALEDGAAAQAAVVPISEGQQTMSGTFSVSEESKADDSAS